MRMAKAVRAYTLSGDRPKRFEAVMMYICIKYMPKVCPPKNINGFVINPESFSKGICLTNKKTAEEYMFIKPNHYNMDVEELDLYREN